MRAMDQVGDPSPMADYLLHRLRTVGVPVGLADSILGVMERPTANDLARLTLPGLSPRIFLAIQPDNTFLEAIGVRRLRTVPPKSELDPGRKGLNRSHRLRSLRAGSTYLLETPSQTLLNCGGEPAWLTTNYRGHRLIVAGTSISEDLLLYAQGEPEKQLTRPTKALWGIEGERPSYLFADLRHGVAPSARLADDWLLFLKEVLIAEGLGRQDVLPTGAQGALVITGDDDQAELSKYMEQRELLAGLPITYMLHPLTKHSRATMAELQQNGPTEFGIHPDALEAPERYRELLGEQASWFAELTGFRPKTLRNHGFLNDGYWGHASAWESEGIVASSNLPGLDGNILNSSLLPSRLLLNDRLTNHWSLLTAFGDGMVFAAGYSDQAAADRILALGSEVLTHPLPGVICVNVHPQNIAETRRMHDALRELASNGFVAWTLGQCIEWFTQLDGGSVASASVTDSRRETGGPKRRRWRWR